MVVNELVDTFRRIVGEDHVLTDEKALYPYGRDRTLDLHFPFDVLVKPGSSQEIAEILRVCSRYKIPVTPRGGGSGVSGGALPVKRGVVLSLERLDRIIELNATDGYVIAESGVINADLCKWVEERGWYFPVSPSSAAYSFIGGNVAENCGGINSCKYGKTGQYVLNLEVVLATGEVLWTGANVNKNSTGINLTQLFVGSEGILGVVTKVVYKLLPPPGHSVLFLAAFDKLEDACNAVCRIRQSDIRPSATELICRNTLQIINSSNEVKTEAQLFIEIQHPNETILQDTTADVLQWLANYTIEDVYVAQTTADKERLYNMRSSIGNALAGNGSVYRDIDMCVPVGHLYKYIVAVDGICERYNLPFACFGHALDGNLHVMLRCDGYSPAIREIYERGIEMGGVISGEHGIGVLHKEYLPLQFSEHHLSIMRQIKLLFDPHAILNPGKII